MRNSLYDPDAKFDLSSKEDRLDEVIDVLMGGITDQQKRLLKRIRESFDHPAMADFAEWIEKGFAKVSIKVQMHTAHVEEALEGAWNAVLERYGFIPSDGLKELFAESFKCEGMGFPILTYKLFREFEDFLKEDDRFFKETRT